MKIMIISKYVTLQTAKLNMNLMPIFKIDIEMTIQMT